MGSSENIVALAGRFQGGCGVDCLDRHTFHPLLDLPPLNSTTFSARIRGFLVARTISQETLHD